jgi:hypothetical protein
VGKTWLVRDLAERFELDLLEINFERNPEYRKHFSANDPRQIMDDLSLVFGRQIQPQRCLLLLDEIQAAGEVLAKLRWFAEEMPDLPMSGAPIRKSAVNCKRTCWPPSAPTSRNMGAACMPMSLIRFFGP